MDRNPGHKIKIYGTKAFTSRYMPFVGQRDSFRYDYERFMIIRIEDIFPHVNEHVPPVKSLNDILLFISDGQAEMEIGAESYRASRGEVLYIPAGQLFSFKKYDSVTFTTGFLITYTHEILGDELLNRYEFSGMRLLEDSGSYLFVQEEPSYNFITELLERMLKENVENALTRPGVIRTYLLALLLELDRNSQVKNVVKKSASQKLVKDFIAMLPLEIKVKKQPVQYAALLNISPNHLSKMVKKHTGKSPGKWIDETLILEAKVLLFQTDLNISEIAISLGISDASYFSRLFKKYEGITPVSFRREARKVK